MAGEKSPKIISVLDISIPFPFGGKRGELIRKTMPVSFHHSLEGNLVFAERFTGQPRYPGSIAIDAHLIATDASAFYTYRQPMLVDRIQLFRVELRERYEMEIEERIRDHNIALMRYHISCGRDPVHFPRPRDISNIPSLIPDMRYVLL